MMRNLVIVVMVMINVANLQAQNWNTSLEAALKDAVATDRNVMLFFSVPDACDTCIELEQNVFKTAAFTEFASSNFVLARIDFISTPGNTMTPEAKAKNLLIVEKYNKDGFFPLVVVIDKFERVLGKAPIYEGQPAENYIRLLQNISR